MQQDRIIGIGATIAGFVVVALASIWLTQQNLDAGGVLMRALVVFVFVAPIFIYGIYRYSRAEAADENLLNEEMKTQREMMDIIAAHGKISMPDLARELNTDTEHVKALVISLLELEVFNGYADWAAGIVYSAQAWRQKNQRTLPE